MPCRLRSSPALIRPVISVPHFVPAIESTLLHLVLFFCRLLFSANPIAGKEPMAVSGSCSGDEVASAPSSPKNKVKFLCSHGGKILPRPADGHLKYVGGETRVVSVPRDISFSELMKKLSALFEGDMILKYQLAAEDLDALVTVKSDEDLKHMFDEYDHHAGKGTPRLRAFLFPSVPTMVETQPAASLDPHALEQRYIDAVNGVIRMSLSLSLSPIPGPSSKAFYSPSRATFSISSACSSPKSPSPDSNPEYPASQEAVSVRSYRGNSSLQHPVHKVHSSPSLYGLGNVPHGGHGPGNALVHQQYNHHYGLNHHQHQHQHSYQHQHQHQNQNQNQHQFSYHPPRPLQVEPYRGTGHDRLPSPSGIGRTEIGRSPLNQGIGPYYPDTGKSHLNQGMGPYYPAGRNQRANGYNNSISDDFGVYSYRKTERAGSLPQSPRTAIWEGQCYKGEQS